MGNSRVGTAVTDYAIDFRIRAMRSEWNQAAQVDAFLLGLADYIKDELVSYDLPASLDEIIALASRVDRRIQARQGETAGTRRTASGSSSSSSFQVINSARQHTEEGL